MSDTWLCRKCREVIDLSKDQMGWMPVAGQEIYGHRINAGTSLETFCGPVTLEAKAEAGMIPKHLYSDDCECAICQKERTRPVKGKVGVGARDVILNISSWLGFGPGGAEWTTASDMEARIKQGIDHHINVQAEQRTKENTHALRAELESLPAPAANTEGLRPKIVCLCGSTRFTAEMLVKQWELSKKGIIVLSWCALPDGYFEREGGKISDHVAEAEGVKESQDELHKRKIDMADEVYVLNIGGYIGESTRSEIEYAKAHGKPVHYEEGDAALRGESRP